MKKIITILFWVLILISASCSNPTEIDNKTKPVRDPRTFTWTVDTLSNPDEQITMTSIWGSSPNDVYFCGDNSLPLEGKFWHYDGTKLEAINLSIKLQLLAHSLTKVFGFSRDNVWVIGSQGVPDPRHIVGTVEAPLIVHFDGVNWNEYRLDFYDYNPNHYSAPMYSVYGDKPDNVWVSGANGWIAHFDGNSWQQDTLTIDDPTDLNLVSIRVYNNEVYILAQENKPNAIYHNYVVKGTIKNWKVIDSFWANETAKFGYSNLYTNFGKLYSLVPDVYEYSNNGWTDVIKLPSNYSSFFMSGTSEDNILISSYNGLFHWNGTDIKQMDLPNYHLGDWVWEIWYDGQEAFAVGFSYFDASKSFFWHGK